MAQEKPGKKVIAQNREAHHEYFVIEALETARDAKRDIDRAIKTRR